MRLLLTICGLVLVLGMATNALGQTSDVKQLDIQPGSLEIGLDNSFFGGLPRIGGTNRSAHDQSIDYGLREWWRVSGALKLENPDDADLRDKARV